MKKTIQKIAAFLLSVVLMVSLSACGQQTVEEETSEASKEVSQENSQEKEPAAPEAEENSDEVDGELILDYEEELQYAKNFTLTNYKGGYKMFTIPDSMGENQYLLVPEGKTVPADLSENTIVLQQPLTKIASAISAATSLIDAIDGLDNIVAVATAYEDWYLPNVIAKMDADEIKYMGSYSEPDFEMLMELGVQVEFDSTMMLNKPEIMDKYAEVGIPCIVDNSSKEEHLLGRIEWVKLYGAVLGMNEEAKAYFDEQVAKVESISSLEKTGKTAVMYYKSNDIYYVRNAADYCTSMLVMAGGESIAPELGDGKSGSSKLNAEEFYATCKDADYVFQVVMECPYTTIAEMIEYDSLFADFKAVQEGNVYTTVQGFSQSNAILADVVVELSQVLNDPSIEKTENLIKIKSE